MSNYIVLEDFVPYENAFLFHIFKNNDRIELNHPHTTIMVWIHKTDIGYSDKGVRNRLRVEIQKDDLNLMRDFFVLKSILAQEVMDFLEFDFDVKDVLCCISCI